MQAPPSIKNILERVPGRLALDCTDLTAEYPHGGSAIGQFGSGRVVMRAPVQFVTAEEWGIEIVDAIHGGEVFTFAAVAREWDVEAWGSVFLNTEAGATSGALSIKSPGTLRAGERLRNRSRQLVFSPFDTDRDPFVVFHRAIPYLDAAAQLNLNLAQDAGVGMVWVAVRDDDKGTYFVGRGVDAVL